MKCYDLVIVGGGLVGSLLSAKLAQILPHFAKLRIAVVEPLEPQQQWAALRDVRTVALSAVSVDFLKSLNVWTELAAHATAIKKIHISEQHRLGHSLLDAANLHQEALGYVVPNAHLTQILQSTRDKCSQIELYCPWQLLTLQRSSEGYALSLKRRSNTNKNYKDQNVDRQNPDPKNTERTISARLLIAADGIVSPIRNLLNIGARERFYDQAAVVANVEVTDGKDNQAFERFTPNGPLALLPIGHHWYSLVWCVSPKQASHWLETSESEFLRGLQKTFGYRLGHFKSLGPRQVFPLKQIWAEEQIQPHVLLLGNSMHFLHPVAGQGFNLSLRDVQVLTELLTEALQGQKSFGNIHLLEEYVALRRVDQQLVRDYTDGLIKTFTHRFPGIKDLRSLGLMIFDFVPGLRLPFANFNLGVTGRARASGRKLIRFENTLHE